MAVAAQVVAGQVNQHHVLCILLGIVLKVQGVLTVLLGITGTFGGTCNGVNVSGTACYAAVCLRAGTEYAESAKIKVKQIRAGIMLRRAR